MATMQSGKAKTGPDGAGKDDVIVAPQVLITPSDGTTQHHIAEPITFVNGTVQEGQCWEDEESRDHRSYWTRLLTNPVPLWLILLQCFSLTLFTVHMVQWHGWPWAPAPPCLHPMKLTQGAEQACIQFEGLKANLCWDTTRPGWWASDPTSWEKSAYVTNSTWTYHHRSIKPPQ
jgi:hypothetical protein